MQRSTRLIGDALDVAKDLVQRTRDRSAKFAALKAEYDQLTAEATADANRTFSQLCDILKIEDPTTVSFDLDNAIEHNFALVKQEVSPAASVPQVALH